MFSAHLRLPAEKPLVEKDCLVQNILEDLGMTECGHVLVRDISGGQRRRVSIGLELVVNPSVLLLDVSIEFLKVKGVKFPAHTL